MSDSSPSDTGGSNVSWGKVIAGAALAAGAVAAFAFFAVDIQSTVVPALQSALQETGNAIAFGFNWIGENIIGSAAATVGEKGAEGLIPLETAKNIPASGIVGFITKNTALAATAAAVAGGLYAARMGNPAAAEKALEAKSFAMEEDMRRVQTLMRARMMANNYEPAMALANNGGMGRG